MKFSFTLNFDFSMVFVGGAMRSGTTMLHALLCTSGKSNGYVAECRYFTEFIQPFFNATAQFDLQSKFYFNDKAELKNYHAHLMAKILCDIRDHLGSPEILVLKDPFITPYVPFLIRTLPLAKGVVSIRDPRGCVASLISGALKNNELVDIDKIKGFCRHYNDSYKPIIENFEIIEDHVIIVKYEDIVNNSGMFLFKKIGITDLRPSDIWNDSITDVSQYKNHSLYSDLYGKGISNERVAKFRSVLSNEQEDLILSMCEDTALSLQGLYNSQSA